MIIRTDPVINGPRDQCAVVIIRKNRVINRKNQSLAVQIAEAVNFKQKYFDEHYGMTPSDFRIEAAKSGINRKVE